MKLKKIIIFLGIITSIQSGYSMLSEGPIHVIDVNDWPYKNINGLSIAKTPMMNDETGDILEVYQGSVHDSIPNTTVAGKVIQGPNKGKFYLLGIIVTRLTPQEAFEELKSEYERAPAEPVEPLKPQEANPKEIEMPRHPVHPY